MKTKLIAVLLGLVAVAAFLGIPFLRQVIAGAEDDDHVVGSPVVVGRPVVESLTETLEYGGTLAPEYQVVVTPKISGKLEQVFVEEGDAITKDEPIARLDDEVVRLQRDQAYAAWQAAKAQYEKALRGVRDEELANTRALVGKAEKDLEVARTNLERTERLYEAGTLSKAKLEEAQNAFRGARTEVENARRSLELMEEGASAEDRAMARANAQAAETQFRLADLQVQYAAVHAPVSGTVAKVMAEEGSMVGPTTALVALVDDMRISAEVAVPELHYGSLVHREGELSAWVRPVAYPDHEPFRGTVASVSPVVDPTSRTFTVSVAVDDSAGLLRAGMYVNVEILVRRVDRALTLPSHAVVLRGGEHVVFAVEPGNSMHARMVPVVLGLRHGEKVQIASGLSPDMPVVLEGNAFLEDGQQVRVIDPS